MDDYAIPVLRNHRLLDIQGSDMKQINRRSWLQDNEKPLKMKLASNRRRNFMATNIRISRSLDELSNSTEDLEMFEEPPPPLPERHYSRRGTLFLQRSKSDQQIDDGLHSVNQNGGDIYDEPWNSEMLVKMIQEKMKTADGLERSVAQERALQRGDDPKTPNAKSGDSRSIELSHQTTLDSVSKNSSQDNLDQVDSSLTGPSTGELTDTTITPLFKVDISKPLFGQSWYHFECSRESAEAKLRNESPGAFLVRPMALSKKDFSLSLQDGQNIIHLGIIRQTDGKYVLGTFSQPFPNIASMIKFYSANTLRIKKANHLNLKKPVLYSLEAELSLG